MKRYTLPELPCDYSALEQHYSGRLLTLHHDQHHAEYVTGANTTLEKLGEARIQEDFAAINQLQRSLAFQLRARTPLALWKKLSPEGGGEPEDERRSERCR